MLGLNHPLQRSQRSKVTLNASSEPKGLKLVPSKDLVNVE